jgi:hypothetical protein
VEVGEVFGSLGVFVNEDEHISAIPPGFGGYLGVGSPFGVRVAPGMFNGNDLTKAFTLAGIPGAAGARYAPKKRKNNPVRGR